MLRWIAFVAACVFWVAIAWGAAVVRAPRVLDLEYPDSKAEAKDILAGGTAAHRKATEGDQIFIPIYSAQVAGWVLWIVFGVGEKERLAQAAGVGALLMLGAAAVSDYRENAQLFALLDAWDSGGAAWSSHQLGPLRVECARKWGYLGLAMVLAGIGNGIGRWVRRDFRWDARRLRTLVCVVGGAAGLAGAVFGFRAAFSLEAVLLGLAAGTVIWETAPRRYTV